MNSIKKLQQNVEAFLAGHYSSLQLEYGELTIECNANDYLHVMRTLHDHADFKFESLIDLCGVDYSTYGDSTWQGKRFAVVNHLLSVKLNQRIRVRVFADDDDFPVVESLVSLHNGADWYEREAFDLFGIMFNKHPDLRRILTDYGFVGHPFRKDFPISGYVEMRYDEVERRVIYQPVTIEPREIIPRVIREEQYGG